MLITPENLIKMWSRLHPRSRASAVWYINSELEPALYMMRMGDTPLYIPPAGMTAAPYGTLLGRPVLPIEHCSAAGEVGDIMLADLSQYLMIDKGGINAASSVHVRFLYDENVFRFPRTTSRYGTSRSLPTRAAVRSLPSSRCKSARNRQRKDFSS